MKLMQGSMTLLNLWIEQLKAEPFTISILGSIDWSRFPFLIEKAKKSLIN